MQEQKMATDNLILKTVTGSHLYGTERADSDLDYMGVFIPSKEYVLGLKTCEQVELSEKHKDVPIDYTCYSVMKYIHLAIQNNPNILSLLYTPPERINHCNEYGRILLDNRDLFLSKKAYHTFRGYAHQQKTKMVIQKREGKRKEDVEKFGFDPKFAMHLMRLYYECIDIMVNGTLVYPSPHRRLLLDIREGKKELDWIFAESTRLEALIDEAYVKTTLQHSADSVKIEEIQMEMLETYWRKND